MTNRAQATAALSTVKLGKREFLLSPMTDEDYGILDRWIQHKHVNVARDTLAEDATEAQIERTERIALMQASQLCFLSEAGSNIIGSSVEGWAMILWCTARRNHPDMTPELFREILSDPLTLEDAHREWDRINNNEETEPRRQKDASKKKKLKKKMSKESKRRNR